MHPENFARRIYPGLRLERSAIGDLGVFASVCIPRGSTIVPQWHEAFYAGLDGWVELTSEQMLKLPPRQYQLFVRYGLDVDFSRIIGPTAEKHVITIDNFLNHSCDPNLQYDFTGNVIARHDIAAGEELRIDYGFFSVNLDEPFECLCGSQLCRGRVTKNDWRFLALRFGFAMPKFLHGQIRQLQEHTGS